MPRGRKKKKLTPKVAREKGLKINRDEKPMEEEFKALAKYANDQKVAIDRRVFKSGSNVYIVCIKHKIMAGDLEDFDLYSVFE